MDNIVTNSEKSETSDHHRQLLNLLDKIKLKRSDKHVSLSNLSIYYTWKNIKKSYKNNKFKISVPTWNEEFELPDGSYSASVPPPTANQNNNDKEVGFNCCPPITDCIREINNAQIDHAKYTDVIIPMYNLIEYGNNYSKTSGSL